MLRGLRGTDNVRKASRQPMLAINLGHRAATSEGKGVVTGPWNNGRKFEGSAAARAHPRKGASRLAGFASEHSLQAPHQYHGLGHVLTVFGHCCATFQSGRFGRVPVRKPRRFGFRPHRANRIFLIEAVPTDWTATICPVLPGELFASVLIGNLLRQEHPLALALP